MNLYLISNGETIDITEIVTSATLKGDYRSCCRTLDFGIISAQTDENTRTVYTQTGDTVKLVENGETMFHGIIFSRDIASDGKTIDFECKDYGIYLKKNSGFYKFKGMTPESIARKICTDYGIATGSIAAAGKGISRVFMGVTLYDIIMTAYSMANDKKYMVLFKGKNLNIIEKGVEECFLLESKGNLLTATASESLDDMVNRVTIYNKKNAVVKRLENASDIAAYGLMSSYVKASDTKKDYTQEARKKLKGITRKVTVTNFGDVSYMTGKTVMVKENYTGIIGEFYIDGDEHNWKNGIYTNKLTLNYENIMDEKESGSEKE